jgi:hypothetical protein
MSQTLLFSAGLAVFAITVCATLLYGYFTLDGIYQAEAAQRLAVDLRQETLVPAAVDEPEALIPLLAPVPE